MTHKTTQRVRHQGKVYLPGEPIELTAAEAQQLGTAVKGEIKPQESEKPTTQANAKPAARKPAAKKTEA